MSSFTLSFEFFPPKTAKGVEKLRHTRTVLAELKPDFFSVTFGAGGSTREGTLETVAEIQQENRVDAAPHISCIGSTRDSIGALLDRFTETGIRRLVCLRGDIPSGMVETGEFHYANELISFVREKTKDQFHIECAAYPEVHPQAPDADKDLENFKRKVDSGADGAITQYFFNIDAYLYFRDRCAKSGITLPIVPGIMPINNYEQLSRFSSACGAEIPRWLDRRLQAYGDDLQAIREFGKDVVSELCRRLLEEDAPGLHFYTLNQHEASIEICRRLALDQPR